MNARQDLSVVPSSSLAMSLAESALRLRGPDIQTFVEQFLFHATKPSAVRVTGDGKMFRQALCFPVSGMAPDASMVIPFPGLPPHVLIELGSGHVIAFRINDSTPSRLSLPAFMQDIERYQELLAKRDTGSWSGIQQMIEGTQRKRIRFFDFVLDNDPTVFWREYFPQGATRLANRALQGLPITEPGRKRVITTMADIHSDHFRRACADFIGRLDADRIKAIRLSGHAPHLSKYNSYLNSNANSAYRIQAAEANPLLSYLLGSDHDKAERLRRLVDDGQPLWPALADTLSVPEEIVRWLRNKTAEEVGEAWLGRVHKLLPDLVRLPPEKRPKTRDEWTAYTDFILALNDPYIFSSIRSRKDTWLADLARLGWVQAHQKLSAMNASPSDLIEIGDLVENLVSALRSELLPEEDRWQDEDNRHLKLDTAVNQLFFETSVLKQLRASLRWHALQLQPLDADSADAEEDLDLCKWPAPFSKPVHLGSLSAHFLVTPAQLKDEGRRLQHCVGSYDTACLFAGTNIVSFRDGGGRSLSTAELLLDARHHKVQMKLKQHKAHKNSSPPQVAVDAMSELLLKLNHDDMQPRLLEMCDQLVKRQAMDKSGERWNYLAANSPERMRILKAALKLHIGYERFLDVARKAIAE